MPGPYRDDVEAVRERGEAVRRANRAFEPARIGLAFAVLAIGGVLGGWHARDRRPLEEVLDQPSADLPVAPAGMSYDQAASWEEAHSTGRLVYRPLTSSELDAPLRDWANYSCVPVTASHPRRFDIEVGVKYGAAIGVTVYTQPTDPIFAAHVEECVRRMRWPWSSKGHRAWARWSYER